MKTINETLDQVSQNRTQQSSLNTSANSKDRQKLNAIVWQVLLSRKLVTAPVDSVDYKVFISDMADLTDSQMKAGLEATKNFTGFFTFPAFRELCHVTPQSLGLPDARQAYFEACTKGTPWERQNWSHAAVYAAARETGRFELHSMTEREAFPLFSMNYSKMVDRVINGEDLNLPTAKVIAEKIPQFLTPEQNKERLSKLKNML